LLRLPFQQHSLSLPLLYSRAEYNFISDILPTLQDFDHQTNEKEFFFSAEELPGCLQQGGAKTGPGSPPVTHTQVTNLIARSCCGPKQLVACQGPAGRAGIAGELRGCLPPGGTRRARNGCGQEPANTGPRGPLPTNKQSHKFMLNEAPILITLKTSFSKLFRDESSSSRAFSKACQWDGHGFVQFQHFSIRYDSQNACRTRPGPGPVTRPAALQRVQWPSE
jgi:hypothetical protein